MNTIVASHARLIVRWSVASAGGLMLCAGTAWGDANSAGTNGISATGLNLNGAGVTIGQLEPGRAGLAPADSAANSNSQVTPFMTLTVGATPALPNVGIDDHAFGVAGTIISTGPLSAGIAQGARLISTSLAPGDSDATNYATFGRFLAANNAAQSMTNGGARFINHSWGMTPSDLTRDAQGNVTNLGTIDGSSQLTLGLDWSAWYNGVLHVVAGNENGPARYSIMPTDSYNALVVGATQVPAGGSRFTQMASYNITVSLPTDGRRTISLVAPGTDLTVATRGSFSFTTSSGTSFAAPHVTATAALLQQRAFQNQDINGIDLLSPAVMRALLMNSADKVQGILGMDRTITRNNVTNRTGTGLIGDAVISNSNNWLEQRALEGGDAVRNAIPLDSQLGTGALNAARAVTQFNGNRHNPSNAFSQQPVPTIGWDSGVAGTMRENLYRIASPIPANEWISVTLCWDRRVDITSNAGPANEFNAELYLDRNGNAAFNAGTDGFFDVNGNGTYDPNTYDSFTDIGLVDLDLYLINSLGQTVARSVSTIYNVEHIFFQVPANDTYTISVVNSGGNVIGNQSYGLAWWTIPTPSAASLIMLGGLAAARRRRA